MRIYIIMLVSGVIFGHYALTPLLYYLFPQKILLPKGINLFSTKNIPDADKIKKAVLIYE